jgi:nicotinamide phosphoribosyltransferase
MTHPKDRGFSRFVPTAQTQADSYKLGHADQYPKGTEFVQVNFTPRNTKYQNCPAQFSDGKVVWFGTQDLLLEFEALFEAFFSKSKAKTIAELVEFNAAFCGANGFDGTRWAALHDLGYLPLEIRSLPEGTVVHPGIPVITIINTHKDFYWLPNYLETWLSCQTWLGSTSATTARNYRKILNHFVNLTGGSKEFADWQIHDFSMRGMSTVHAAARSGAGHLLFSLGTDCLPAVKLINDVYKGKETFVGGSVPATEHSVMCAGGKDSELETFERLIETYPSGVLSIVSDTWDFWRVITDLAFTLKDKILARTIDSLGLAKIVFRPDSGDPVRIICGYRYDEVEEILSEGLSSYDQHWMVKSTKKFITENEKLGAVRCLAKIFGTTINELGFKTLNPRVGLIYGDSITPQRAYEILQRLHDFGFASDNIVFGVGSYTYQYVTRDTNGFAMKATWCQIAGEAKSIFKEPKTDDGVKKSAKGYVTVVKDAMGDLKLVETFGKNESSANELKLVFKDGEILSNEDFATMRTRAQSSL